jgi:cytochrome c6
MRHAAPHILRSFGRALRFAGRQAPAAVANNATRARIWANDAEPGRAGCAHNAGTKRPSSFDCEPFPPPMKKAAKFLAPLAGLALIAALVQAAPVAENWENHCAKCHGADGKGQTKAGKKLGVKDYTDAKAQAEMKDADMEKAIVDGVFDKAGKEKMKAYKEELSAAEAKELVAYIRKMKG